MIELLILYILLKRDFTMYSIRKHIDDNFAPYTAPSFGAINPALKRLIEKDCISSRKQLSDGGKLSVYYSLTSKGINELKRLVLENYSNNPHQFLSDARIKLSCAECLNKDERTRLFFSTKTKILEFKNSAQNILNNEYLKTNFYQKIILDNTVCELSNFLSIVEGLEKDNAGNS